MSEAAIQKIKNLIRARKGYLTQYETKLQNFQTFITHDPNAEMAELYEKLIDALTDEAQTTKYQKCLEMYTVPMEKRVSPKQQPLLGPQPEPQEAILQANKFILHDLKPFQLDKSHSAVTLSKAILLTCALRAPTAVITIIATSTQTKMTLKTKIVQILNLTYTVYMTDPSFQR